MSIGVAENTGNGVDRSTARELVLPRPSFLDQSTHEFPFHQKIVTSMQETIAWIVDMVLTREIKDFGDALHDRADPDAIGAALGIQALRQLVTGVRTNQTIWCKTPLDSRYDRLMKEYDLQPQIPDESLKNVSDFILEKGGHVAFTSLDGDIRSPRYFGAGWYKHNLQYLDDFNHLRVIDHHYPHEEAKLSGILDTEASSTCGLIVGMAVLFLQDKYGSNWNKEFQKWLIGNPGLTEALLAGIGTDAGLFLEDLVPNDERPQDIPAYVLAQLPKDSTWAVHLLLTAAGENQEINFKKQRLTSLDICSDRETTALFETAKQNLSYQVVSVGEAKETLYIWSACVGETPLNTAYLGASSDIAKAFLLREEEWRKRGLPPSQNYVVVLWGTGKTRGDGDASFSVRVVGDMPVRSDGEVLTADVIAKCMAFPEEKGVSGGGDKVKAAGRARLRELSEVPLNETLSPIALNRTLRLGAVIEQGASVWFADAKPGEHETPIVA